MPENNVREIFYNFVAPEFVAVAVVVEESISLNHDFITRLEFVSWKMIIKI